jgi:phosphatidylserine decarboxylase
MITKYGYATIGIVSILSFIIISLSLFINNTPVKIGLILISIVFLLLTINFFRDPERTPPQNENLIISPADGTVLFVKDITADGFIKGKAKQISIFMSPMNVHVNRIPINGTVDYVKYHKGEFFVASDDKASTRNERNEIGITSKFGAVLYTQVAGFVARRIVSELKVGNKVKVGERFGMIKFGSRVDVIVPDNWVPKVKKDDKTTAGETILFECQTNNNK